MVSGRTPNQKVMEYAQLVGIALLLTLLIYANGMDIFRLFK
jgi:regulator of sigma E protease